MLCNVYVIICKIATHILIKHKKQKIIMNKYKRRGKKIIYNPK